MIRLILPQHGSPGRESPECRASEVGCRTGRPAQSASAFAVPTDASSPIGFFQQLLGSMSGKHSRERRRMAAERTRSTPYGVTITSATRRGTSQERDAVLGGSPRSARAVDIRRHTSTGEDLSSFEARGGRRSAHHNGHQAAQRAMGSVSREPRRLSPSTPTAVRVGPAMPFCSTMPPVLIRPHPR